MNSFEGRARMAKNIAPAKDGAVGVRRVTASVVEGGSCYTGDTWHWKAGLAVASGMPAEMRPAENSLRPMKRLAESPESRFRCVQIEGVERVLPMPQTVCHSSSSPHRPSCTCSN